MEIDNKALIYGILSGAGILLFYLSVLTIFQSLGFAIYEFKRLWLWILPLAGGFGTQIGIYTSIKHSAMVNAGVATSGTVSGGSMIVCCSHFLLNIIPLIGLSGLATFLMTYQKVFFSIGIASSIFGIGFMLHHKNKMIKRGKC
jgi:Cu+-exporting ATPase